LLYIRRLEKDVDTYIVYISNIILKRVSIGHSSAKFTDSIKARGLRAF
jgi:hypothetical protein